jgi:two-component system NtrC family sensor kinase
MITILATGITAANYGARRAEFDAQEEALRVAEALAGAQLRAQLAENAISIGKMAAALSHEINSPVGALRSSVSTLISVMDRNPADDEERERLTRTQEQLRHSINESAARIDDVVVRLRRFVNLEEAELKPANINELLTDVALLHQEEIEKGGIQLDFELEKPLPELNCRPQLLSAVFSSLLSNAIQAVNGNGHIGIMTRLKDDAVQVTIRDNGRGMSPEQVESIFDPSFKIAGNRIASGNWSLFNSRQIVYEHGGEISVETAEGKGTAVHVTLPATAP